MDRRIKIALVGAGWRAAGWLRLLKKLQDRFALLGVYCRRAERRKALAAAGVPVADSLGALLQRNPDFVLVCVSKTENLAVCRALLAEGAAVLCETPAGTDEAGSAAFAALRGEKLQFAEQYPFQPRFRAMRAAAERSLIGQPHTLQLSCCHGCHAAALMRFLLGVRGETPSVRVVRLSDAYARIRGREGGLVPSLQKNERILALLRFVDGAGSSPIQCGEKTVLYDFSYPQYFSGIRRPRALLQGTEGEVDLEGGARISGDSFAEFYFSYCRGGTGGNLGAPGLETVSCGGEVLYRNPFAGRGLSDEEIAMGECLLHMQKFVEEGISFYNANEAADDARIAVAIERA